MVGRRQIIIITKKHWLKCPKAVPNKTKFGPKYKWFKISYLKFFFWKYYFRHTTFIYLSRRSTGCNWSFFFSSRFSSGKFKGQKKLAKKITHFTTQVRSKSVTHFTNFNSLDIKNNMLRQHSQKCFFWL